MFQEREGDNMANLIIYYPRKGQNYAEGTAQDVQDWLAKLGLIQ